MTRTVYLRLMDNDAPLSTPRNFDAEYIHILDTDIVGLLEVELYRI